MGMPKCDEDCENEEDVDDVGDFVEKILMRLLRGVINVYKIFNWKLITVVSVEFDTFLAIQYYSD
jgi:hypothetical protein